MYTFRLHSLKKNVSEETMDSPEDEVEGLVRRVKLRLENQYFYVEGKPWINHVYV